MSAEDATVATAHLNARTISRDTPFQTRAGAENLAARLLAIWGEPRSAYRIRAAVENAIETAVDLNAVVSLDIDRWDLAGGKAHRVRRLTLTPRRNLVEVEVWG